MKPPNNPSENGDYRYMIYADPECGIYEDEHVVVEVVNGHVASLDGVMLDEGEPTLAEFRKLYRGQWLAPAKPKSKAAKKSKP